MIKVDGRKPLVVGIGGSTRPVSYSRMLLRLILDETERVGANVVRGDLRIGELPLFDPSRRRFPCAASVLALVQAIREADAVVVCTPTYHGTIAGFVKNALDYLVYLGDDVPPYLGWRPVLLAAVGGEAAMNSIRALDDSIRALRGIRVPTVVVARDSEILAAEHGERVQLLRRIATAADETVRLSLALRATRVPVA